MEVLTDTLNILPLVTIFAFYVNSVSIQNEHFRKQTSRKVHRLCSLGDSSNNLLNEPVIRLCLKGPFHINMTDVRICKGPRHKECANVVAAITDSGQVLDISIDVVETTAIEVVEMIAYRDGNKKSTPLIALKLKKPCEQQFLKDALLQMVSDQKSCLTQKAVHNFSLDMGSLTQKYWAGKFFYGTFLFKNLYYGRKCNFGCSEIKIIYAPRL